MALEKVITEDKIEIIGEFKSIQVRTKTAIVEDGVEISSSFHRHIIEPGVDTSDQSSEVQAICNALHTEEIIAAWQAHVASTILED
jgi:hypothetical protein